jgi:hypothetical protein
MAHPLPNIVEAPLDKRVTSEEAAAALRAVLRMFELWQVSDAEARTLLGEPSKSTFYRWKAGDIKQVPHDTVFRLGDLLGIHKALTYLFMEPVRRYEWVKKPNQAFAGQSALQIMMAGPPAALTRVRTYLDAERGGW